MFLELSFEALVDKVKGNKKWVNFFFFFSFLLDLEKCNCVP